MPEPDRIQRFKEFVNWSDQHITGDEKGQAQIFLDHLFRAFGHDGLLAALILVFLRRGRACAGGGGL